MLDNDKRIETIELTEKSQSTEKELKKTKASLIATGEFAKKLLSIVEEKAGFSEEDLASLHKELANSLNAKEKPPCSGGCKKSKKRIEFLEKGIQEVSEMVGDVSASTVSSICKELIEAK